MRKQIAITLAVLAVAGFLCGIWLGSVMNPKTTCTCEMVKNKECVRE